MEVYRSFFVAYAEHYSRQDHETIVLLLFPSSQQQNKHKKYLINLPETYKHKNNAEKTNVLVIRPDVTLYGHNKCTSISPRFLINTSPDFSACNSQFKKCPLNIYC